MNDKRDYISAAYYQNLHDTNQAFINNNWLVSEFDFIQKLVGDVSSVLEMGCGNGRFLELAAKAWKSVVGVDWARSSYLESVLKSHNNIQFIQTDVSVLKLHESYDLIVSADFLEHLPGELLPQLITELLRAGRMNFHKIACYDDGHSHLSILTPETWLGLFNSQPGGEGVKIIHSEYRKNNPQNIVITLFK